MDVSLNLVFFPGVLVTKALLFGVYIAWLGIPDPGKSLLPALTACELELLVKAFLTLSQAAASPQNKGASGRPSLGVNELEEVLEVAAHHVLPAGSEESAQDRFRVGTPRKRTALFKRSQQKVRSCVARRGDRRLGRDVRASAQA